MRPSINAALAAGMLSLASAANASSGTTTHIVCPAESSDQTCRFKGGSGVQAAVDAASDGDVILIKAGRYVASAYRDVPYKIHTIRGFVVIEGKRLTIRGEPGTILDGGAGVPTTAMVVHRGDVTIESVTISGFRYDVQEDEIYDGHGIFVIDGRTRISGVTIAKFQKMGLIGRGQSLLEVSDVRLVDGHVAVWLEETAYLRLRNALVRNNDSAGIAAYGQSVAHVANSVFDGNLDDGLYSEQDAAIYATNSLLLRNRPYAMRATENSRIWVAHSGLFANAKVSTAKGLAKVSRGTNTIEGDPRVDDEYHPVPGSPLLGKSDPDARTPSGVPAQIGLW